jgi:hypothetical protein
MRKRRNSSHREKNSAATDKENHLLQKIIPLSLHPLQQKIRVLGVRESKLIDSSTYFCILHLLTLGRILY